MGLKMKMFALSLAFCFIYFISITGVEGEPTTEPGQTHTGDSSSTDNPLTHQEDKCADGDLCIGVACVNATIAIADLKKDKRYEEEIEPTRKEINKDVENGFKSKQAELSKHCKSGKCVLLNVHGWKMPVCKGTRKLAAGTLLLSVSTLLAYYIF